MFWNLLLAHFLGDFVFQTDWMVKNRDNLWVLTLHASIHFVMMFILAVTMRSVIWPYLLLIATLHWIQDRIKNNITNKRPNWIGMGFIIDQVIHFAVIWVVIWLFQTGTGLVDSPEKPIWVMVAIAYVCVTYVWFVIERIFNLANLDYLQNINITKFPRMFSRASLISLFLLFWNWATTGLAIVVPNPYPQSKFRQRAVITDVSVSVLAMVFLFWALR